MSWDSLVPPHLADAAQAPLVQAVLARDVDKMRRIMGTNTFDITDNVVIGIAMTVCCRRGLLEETTILLDAKSFRNPADELAPYVLLAASYAQPDIVKALIAHGARIDAKDGDGRDLLLCALSSGDKKTIDYARGTISERNQVDAFGWGVLHNALGAPSSDTVHIVRQLLQDGSPVDEYDAEGVTPLMKAAALDIPEVVELLLRHGASLSSADKRGDTAECWAIRTSASNTLHVLRSATSVKGVTSENSTEYD